MSKFGLFVLTVLVGGAPLISGCAELHINAKEPRDYCEISGECNEPVPGMFFSSDNVVEEYEYDEGYCIVYDDADANLFNVEILVDLETYELCLNSHEVGRELIGNLYLNDDYSYGEFEVYTFVPSTEFDIADEKNF